MPLYEYDCTNCGAGYQERQSFAEAALTYCPSCETDSLVRVLFPPTIFDATPKTLGTVADRNSRPSYWLDMKREELASARQKGVEELNANLPRGMSSARPEKAERPWYRSGNKPEALASLTTDQKINYVYTGDPAKPPG